MRREKYFTKRIFCWEGSNFPLLCPFMDRACSPDCWAVERTGEELSCERMEKEWGSVFKIDADVIEVQE